MEIWKDVLGYETHYEISSHGRLRSKDKVVPCKGGKTRRAAGKMRKLFLNKKGYVIATLSLGGKLATFTIHQLVAQAFMSGFVKGDELNHDDGDKTNNKISNLELSNPSHNQLHAVRNGLVPKVGASRFHNVTCVTYPSGTVRWAGSIRHAKQSSFGWKTFHTEEEAARHVDSILDSIGDTQRIRNKTLLP